jgi:hypothetical protein
MFDKQINTFYGQHFYKKIEFIYITFLNNRMANQTFYNINFTNIDNDDVDNLRKTYEVVDVKYINLHLINYEIFNSKISKNKKTIHDMIDLVYNDKDKHIFTKTTDYLCNADKKICICNMNADKFRQIYEGINYKKDIKYIAWINEDN